MLGLLAALVLVALVPPLVLDLFRPTVRRLGLRNARRRPGESALVVGGSMLATALITASLLIGDSFGSSVRDQVGTRLGPIDEVVFVTDPTTAAASLTAADTAAVSGSDDGEDEPVLDGVLAVRYGTVSAGGVGDNATVLGRLQLVELDAAGAQGFGDDAQATGLAATTTLDAGQVVVAAPTAATLGVGVGDRLQVFVDDDGIVLEVVAVPERRGLVGFGDLIVAPAAITGSLDDPDDATIAAVLVSNSGDTTDGAELTDDAVALFGTALGDGVEYSALKKDLLDEADDDAASMTELFGTVGGFSVIAGILLLVNLFVMLAAERRSELGTLAAIGLDRSHLRRAFALEGAVYGLLASIGGAVLGVAVAAVVMRLAPSISSGEDVAVSLSVSAATLLSGAAIGFAISQLTVTVTAHRLTRLHIVSALKNLDEPPTRTSGRSWAAVGIVVVLVSLELLYALSDQPLVVLVAPVTACLGAVPVLARLVGGRVALAIGAAVALVLTATAFSLWDTALADPELELFLVQGVLLVGLAVAVLGALGDRLVAPIRRLGEGSPAVRIGLAHPMSRPARSGLLIAMYALVIFTVTFMAILNAVFQQQVPDLARQAGGTFDLVLDTNPSNPLGTAELTGRDDVALAVPVRRGELDYSALDADGERYDDYWWASVVDATFPADRGAETVARATEFATDAEVWRAVGADDGWIVVPTDAGFAPGDQLDVTGPDGPIPVRVAATVGYDWALESGFWVGPSIAAAFDDETVVARHYLVAAPTSSADALADALRTERTHGAVATTFFSIAQSDVDEQQAFIRLLQGYLGLGLGIGITGLGVVLVRAVRERRGQLATLAAMGSPPSDLRSMIVIEAMFVGLQGVALGLGLGVASAWLVLTRSKAFAADLRFAVPVTWLVVLFVVAVAASVVAGIIPARRAGRVHPAAALRAG